MLRCQLLILVVKLGLRLMGFARTWRWLQRRATQSVAQDDVSVGDLVATEYRVALAAALWPGRALCLEQSLVLYYVLRRAAVAVEFRMGVQPHPFAAHAWVEYQGAPINDVAEHVKHFMPLPDALP
ncbi:MAG TPA: lasso peptide biosynthesis B2 protein [Gemmatimonadaceae bacterium]